MAVSKNQEASCSAHVRMISSNETLELEQIQNSKENDRLEKKIPLSTFTSSDGGKNLRKLRILLRF